MWGQGQEQRYTAEPDDLLFQSFIELSCTSDRSDFTCMHSSHSQRQTILKLKGKVILVILNESAADPLGAVAFLGKRSFSRC